MLTPWTSSVAGGRGQVLGLLWATGAHADGAQHAALHTHLRLLNPSPCRRMLSPKWQPGHRAYVLLETAAPVPGGGTELCHTHSAQDSHCQPHPLNVPWHTAPIKGGGFQRALHKTRGQTQVSASQGTRHPTKHLGPTGDSLSAVSGSHIYAQVQEASLRLVGRRADGGHRAA